MRRSALALVLVTLAPLAACGGGGGDDGMSDDEHYDCSMEPRADTFVVGLEKISTSGLHYQLTMAAPAPPARGDNHFTLLLETAAAAPMPDAPLTVVPYMPDHGHGTAVPVVITESATVIGEYDINPVNLHMPGLWQVRMNISNSADDLAVFAFCIPG